MKSEKIMKKLLVFILFTLFAAPVFPQEASISAYLKRIEAGERDAVKTETAQLIKSNPTDPSYIFLSAVLMEDAEEAVKNFTFILQNYPKSNYADAAVYRLYLYFYAIGSYMKAEGFANKLRSDYPSSSYIKMLAPQKDLSTGTKEESPKEETVKKEEIKKNSELFTIQVGAFTSDKNAADLKRKFESEKFTVEIGEKTVGGTELKIVYAGKYRTKSEAEANLPVIQRLFDIEGRVVQLHK